MYRMDILTSYPFSNLTHRKLAGISVLLRAPRLAFVKTIGEMIFKKLEVLGYFMVLIVN